MFVSMELLAIVVSALGVIVTIGIGMFSGFAWVIRRMDAVVARSEDGLRSELGGRITSLRSELGGRITGLRSELGGQMTSLRSELGGQMTSLRTELGELKQDMAEVKRELVEVKIAVARVEGPRPHLIPAR